MQKVCSHQPPAPAPAPAAPAPLPAAPTLAAPNGPSGPNGSVPRQQSTLLRDQFPETLCQAGLAVKDGGSAAWTTGGGVVSAGEAFHETFMALAAASERVAELDEDSAAARNRTAPP